MTLYELRDPDEARRHVLQGLWLARAAAPAPEAVRQSLQWSLEIASGGSPLPPAGLVADIGHLALGTDTGGIAGADALIATLPAGLTREYEDYLLGKLYADRTFQRGADALLRYRGRDRTRGLAFLLTQFTQRAGIGGVILSPAVIKTLLGEPAEEILAEGWQSIDVDGLSPALIREYERMIEAVRYVGEVLGPEDVFELEHGTALAGFGQRVALRQVLQVAAEMERRLPHQRPRPRVRRHQVATRFLEEDLYPVGGFASIANRGTMESLLHSQLAYMEPQQRPDLFDVKFLRDELLYYSRDENQFLRRRETFIFALGADLVHARFKGTGLPYQRIVLLLSVLLVAAGKLTEWLSSESLLFEFLFLDAGDESSLRSEKTLVQTLLREQIAGGTVVVESIAADDVGPRCQQRARRSRCQCLWASTRPAGFSSESADVAELVVAGPRPDVRVDGEAADLGLCDDAVEAWTVALQRLLEWWIS